MILYSRTDETAKNAIYLALDSAPVIERKNKRSILNCACAFDTEASSFYDDEGNKVGLLYAWMFGVEDTIVYGRTTEDLRKFVGGVCDYLSTRNREMIVFVHNLKYDYAFIRKVFQWDKVFATDTREILYAQFRNLTFRDSLILSGNKSLAYIGSHLKTEVKKAVGDLNYDLIRTPETPLTSAELHYCEQDIRVLVQYIREKIISDGDITKIPLTNTGYVRRYVRDKCFEDRNSFLKLIDGLTMTPHEYQNALYAFAGGAVGPNISKIGKKVYNVASYDIKSSYPYVMVSKPFPMGYGRVIPSNDVEKYIWDRHWMTMGCFEFFNLRPLPDNNYCFPISESKCVDTIGAFKGAGRVITAFYVKIYGIDLDYQTWTKFYTWDMVRFSDTKIYPAGRLPKPIVDSVFHFFHAKTTLDGVEGKEAEYMLSKNMLNSVYGMMVERPVRPAFELLDDGLLEKIDPDLMEEVAKYNDKWNRFTFYNWGLWVTGWARYRLYEAIKAVGDNFVYCDTDSVKFESDIATDYFEAVNREAELDIIQVGNYYNIPLDVCIPRSPRGERKILGTWEREYEADVFKTIGPKRYMYLTKGKYKMVAAGVNKQSAMEWMEVLSKRYYKSLWDCFSDDLTIPSDYSKRLTSTFVDDERCGYIVDYTGKRRWYRSPSGVHMEPSAYHFTVPDYTKEAIAFLLGDWTENTGNY